MIDYELRDEDKYTLEELEEEETISEGQADDLKIEKEVYGTKTRIWLSRCDIYDGEPFNNKVTVEKYIDGRWIEVAIYEAE